VGVKYQCNILEGRRAGSCVEEVVAYEPERMLATRMVSDTWGLDTMFTDFRVETTVSRRTERITEYFQSNRVTILLGQKLVDRIGREALCLDASPSFG
jgi:hypothetical protein